MLNLKYELLKLEKAVQLQGEEKKRQAETNKKEFNNTSNALPTRLQEYINSIEILNSYKNNHKVSHAIFNEKNSGSTFAQWQKGLASAKGKYLRSIVVSSTMGPGVKVDPGKLKEEVA